MNPVKVDNLSGKNIGLLLSRPDTFSNSWYPGCVSSQHFIPILVDVYNELSPQGNFEIIFVSAETDKYSFIGHFSKMPWLAIPFSDLERRRLVNRFSQKWWSGGFPYLLIFDGNGKIIRKNGVEIIRNYGVEGYPFTEERITLLKEQEEASKKAESLSSILVSPSRDFLISNDGKKVPISELEGKTVALYFSFFTNGLCMEFTPILVEVYEKLKKRGENFEVVLVSLDEDEEKYKEDFQKMPCLSLPFNDKRCNKMVRYFQVRKLPMLVIVGPDGKTLNPNVVELVEDHGVQAYPFTPERLEEVEKAKQEAQTLESVLVLGELDFVIDKEGTQIPVSQLVGKNILLYFPDGTGNDSYGILPKMINVYHEIKAKDDAFEVIFISDENYYYLFEEFFSEMPWLAFPCGDERSEFLRRSFRISLISTVIAIGPTGKTITKNAREPLLVHGADAYPFTEERLKEIEAKLEETVEGWPEKVKHVHFTKTKMGMHVRCKEEHELVLARRPLYDCYVCWEAGSGWSYHCEECGNFILHPKCVLVEDKEDKDGVEDGKRSFPIRPIVQSQDTHPNVLVDVPFDSNPSIRGWTNWMDWRQSKSVEDDGIDQASKEYGTEMSNLFII
ncbi:hypothetical protein NE237_021298 [Protea cynaroides]|uniref:protein-disulfide reductase n=1 Tax=Protea cynaroides TaxID=273540 RepID=A0A9Q0HAV6_9MAGN|nr:hypothetical protein NE237_021298 [Protea cynaroides]